ncbi:hypothetical protein CARUB_v10022401mg, partial [Capsella rubella]
FLPAKSLVKFQCVSKQWSFIISRRRDFIDSIVTRSLKEPPRDAHLIFQHTSGHPNECFFVFSSNYNCTTKKSLLIPENMYQYLRGLIFCWSNIRREAAVYNPTTRQCFHLPKIKETSNMGICFFGYDPLQNQYKVLFLPLYYSDKGCHVFTLGGHHTSNQWRTIQGVSGYHLPLFGSLQKKDYNSSIYELMSFDVRSEKFCNVDAPKTLTDHYSILINYKGKLGFVCCWNIMEIWIRDDGDHDQKTQGWLWVLYYDPERNCIRYMDLEGTHPIERRHHQNSIIVWTFPDYVENTMRLY